MSRGYLSGEDSANLIKNRLKWVALAYSLACWRFLDVVKHFLAVGSIHRTSRPVKPFDWAKFGDDVTCSIPQ